MAQIDGTMSGAPDTFLTHEAKQLGTKNQRLQALVGELLVTNQELRFRVKQLEQEKGVAERALEKATVHAGLLMP